MNTIESDINSESILESLFLALPELSSQHALGSKVYALLKKIVRRDVDDMPTSYREGTLFVTCKNVIPW